MSEGIGPAAEASSPRPSEVVRDGVVAGLIGAGVVAVAHGAADALSGELLRTPTVLGALLTEGAAAARAATPDPELALEFTGLHVAVWLVLGIAGSGLITLVDTRPKLASLVFGTFAFVFISLSYLSGAYAIPGLGAMHLWVGTLLGSAAAAGYLSWRHPQLAAHIEGVRLTGTTRSEIERALALETSGCAAFEAAAAAFPDSPLERVLEEKRGHVLILSKLVTDLGLQTPTDPRPAWQADSADAAMRAAIAHERELVDLYDRFLAGVPELHIRDVFLRLRFHAVDSTIAQLERALERA